MGEFQSEQSQQLPDEVRAQLARQCLFHIRTLAHPPAKASGELWKRKQAQENNRL